jgi:adenosylcobyric acid synthase
MTAKTLMIVGTASSVGKSLLVAALCRIFAQDGWRVAPFKAQNMSLNSYATLDGKEIGRAQAVQAQAAGIEPTVEMNPILLKPEADARSQVVVLGKPWQTLQAADYYQRKAQLWEVVTTALDTLRAQYELIVIEGAGSALEPNFRHTDMVNLSVAAYAHAPAVLAGDIDRGGVFAALLGTLELLTPAERALIRGFIINKFRGDPNLLTPALDFITERTGVPVVGVVPYLRDLRIAEEDGVSLEQQLQWRTQASGDEIDIAVIALSRIANYDDFDALALEAGVRVRYVSTPAELGQPHAIILPGTKSTIADLEWLNRVGLSALISAHARRGAPIVGICGGYQMLGRTIHDPLHVESERASVAGLNLLPVETMFEPVKATEQVRACAATTAGCWAELVGDPIEGYEIHMGQTTRTGEALPLLHITQRGAQIVNADDGAIDASGKIFGTYLHGIFDNPNFRRAWLRSLGHRHPLQGTYPSSESLRAVREREYDRLAAAVRAALDMDAVRALVGERETGKQGRR